MIYELRTYTSKNNFEVEESADYIAWETDRKNCASPCGKLLNYLSDKKTVRIPDGIETIGKVPVNSERSIWIVPSALLAMITAFGL